MKKNLETYLTQNEKTYHSIYGINALAVYHLLDTIDDEQFENQFQMMPRRDSSVKSLEYYKKYFRFKFAKKS